MTTASMPVSVVIPTRNRAHLAPLAIRSALEQTNIRVEVVVVDDGSSDETPGVLAALDDPRLVVVRRDKDHGEPQARNTGAQAASYDILAFLDDDDRWAPTKLHRQLEALASANADWSVCGARIVTPSGQLLGKGSVERIQTAVQQRETLRLFLTTNQVPGPGSSLVVRRSVFESVGSFNPSVPLFADWDLYIRLAAHGDPALVDAPLVDYVQHEGQMTKDLSEGWDALVGFRERYGNHRSAEDVRVSDETVLWWVASRQLRSEGLGPVLRRLWQARVISQPSDLVRVSRTLVGVAAERLGK